MRKGRMSSGYTIMELMIVLAVTSVLLMSAILMLSGRQEKTAFIQSVHDTQSVIDQVINNVETGYYSSNGDIKCTDGPTGPQFDRSGKGGTNETCIFIGRVIQFGVGSDKSQYNIFNLAGSRLYANLPVTSLDQAHPVAISKGNITNTNDFPDTTENHNFSQAFKVTAVSYKPKGAAVSKSTSMIGFLSDFPKQNGVNIESGSRTVRLYSIDTNPPNPNPSKVQAVDTINHRSGSSPDNLKEADSASICFKGPINYAIITIGGDNGNDLSTNLDFTTDAARCA